MQTTTATYKIDVTTDQGELSVTRTMPTRPTTNKGIKAHNNKLENWAKNQYPNWTEIKVSLLKS
jgi:hypothetical protein